MLDSPRLFHHRPSCHRPGGRRLCPLTCMNRTSVSAERMKRIHIALGVADVEASAHDYSQRLGRQPDLVIPGEYALWRTETLNFSIRKVVSAEAGRLRHLGWEDPEATAFSVERDLNGILWERFTADQQADEILQIWPGTDYLPR